MTRMQKNTMAAAESNRRDQHTSWRARNIRVFMSLFEWTSLHGKKDCCLLVWEYIDPRFAWAPAYTNWRHDCLRRVIDLTSAERAAASYIEYWETSTDQ